MPALLPPQPHGDRFSPNSCTAPDSAIAACFVPDFWPSTWMPVPSQPHDSPALDCVPFCVVPAALPAVAVDAAVFDCLTSPPLPALLTRTGDASFDAPSWNASDAASAPCAVFASCPAIWMPVPAASDCDDCCVVSALLPAVAVDAATLDCSTEPSLPSLRHTHRRVDVRRMDLLRLRQCERPPGPSRPTASPAAPQRLRSCTCWLRRSAFPSASSSRRYRRRPTKRRCCPASRNRRRPGSAPARRRSCWTA